MMPRNRTTYVIELIYIGLVVILAALVIQNFDIITGGIKANISYGFRIPYTYGSSFCDDEVGGFPVNQTDLNSTGTCSYFTFEIMYATRPPGKPK